MPVYRRNVACILCNTAGEILICERIKIPGSWQFPQGGLKKGETFLDGLHREVKEELGLSRRHYRVLRSRGPYRYLFAQDCKKSAYDGQEQHYFLAILKSSSTKLRLDGKSPEFSASRWIHPAGYDLKWMAPMKRGVYAKVFADFFGVHPRAAKR